eukprot:TRINITY_DN25949_c0_g2_i1.p1 TRINITY_DN25949_c0_g2~~TRINITY_DN25949_c0_g2_i1.p1  ORF type:complete len:1046 (+),score=207.99 TRINITY_DN25949_c0_g2_i1:35-3139(+)
MGQRLLILTWLCSSVAGEQATEQPTAGPSSLRRLQVPAKVFVANAPKLMEDNYMHTEYTFDLNREGMERHGQGELWMSFEGGVPKLRLLGSAKSPKFGEGKITVFLDSSTRFLYANVDLGNLHKDVCIKYPFPDIQGTDRINTLKQRKQQIEQWRSDEAGSWGEDLKLEPLKWTNSTQVDFALSEDKNSVMGLQMKKGDRVVKSIQLVGAPQRHAQVPDDAKQMFEPPADCRLASEIPSSLASVDITPHQRSSALSDLMILFSSNNPVQEWSHLFLVFTSMLLPGDVAVMLEDPEPPNIEHLEHLAFDYSATTEGPTGTSNSEGSMWVDVKKRAFRLLGNAKKTKVGDLVINLMAQGGDDDARIYANVKLEDEDEEQCISYPYPKLQKGPLEALEEASNQKLQFFSISELDGEDCAIFTAPMARGREIHIWVDMEADNPSAFLRSEIHHNNEVVRATTVKRWRSGDDVAVEVQPKSEWKCQRSDAMTGRLASLDITGVHQRSIQLQDALYALHELNVEFAAREILGLTGDVAILVKVPTAPEMQKLPGANFDFSVLAGDRPDSANGHFSLDQQTGKVKVQASAPYNEGSLDIVIELHAGDYLAVKVQDPSKGTSQCQKISLKDLARDLPPPVPGTFDQVEAVGVKECNRYSYFGNDGQFGDVDFWYSEDEDAPCRFAVQHLGKNGTEKRIIDIKTWRADFGDGDDEDSLRSCENAEDSSFAWLSVTDKSRQGDDSLAGVVAVQELGDALGKIGLLSPQATSALISMTAKMPPGSGTDNDPSSGNHEPALPVPEIQNDIMSPLLKTFSFSFNSTFPQQGNAAGGISHSGALSLSRKGVGTGKIKVDTEKRRIYMESAIHDVSKGIRLVETKIIYRADQGRLLTHTKVKDTTDFLQCWELSSAEVLPAEPHLRSKNPFQRGKLVDPHFPVPGAAGGLAKKYSFFISHRKRVEFFVDQNSALVYMSLNNLERFLSAGIQVGQWSTAPIDESWFDSGNDWQCHETKFLDYPEQLAQWDMIQVFLPTHSDEDSRRLNVV